MDNLYILSGSKLVLLDAVRIFYIRCGYLGNGIMRTWYPMDSAPKNGVEIRLNLQDSFGKYHTFAFSPAKWSLKDQCWVSAKSGRAIVCKAVGWQYLNDYQKATRNGKN